MRRPNEPGFPGAPGPGLPLEHREARPEADRAYDAIRTLAERDKAFAKKEFGDGYFWKIKAYMEGVSWRESGIQGNPREPWWPRRVLNSIQEWTRHDEHEDPMRDPNYPAARERRRERGQLGEHYRIFGMEINHSATRRWVKNGTKVLGGAALAAAMPLSGGLGAFASAPLFIAGFREMLDGGVAILQEGWNAAGNWLKRRWRQQDQTRAGQDGYDASGRPNPDVQGMNFLRAGWEQTKAFWRNFVEKTTLEDEDDPTAGADRGSRTRVTERIRELKQLAENPGVTPDQVQRAIEALHHEEGLLQELKNHNLTVKRLYKFGRNAIGTLGSIAGAVMAGMPMGFNDKYWLSGKVNINDRVLVPFQFTWDTLKAGAGAVTSLAYLAARWNDFSNWGPEQHFGDKREQWVQHLKPSHENTKERPSQERTVVEQYIEHNIAHYTFPRGYRDFQKPEEYLRELESKANQLGPMNPACRLAITIDSPKNFEKVLSRYAQQVGHNNIPVDWSEIEIIVLTDKIRAGEEDEDGVSKDKTKEIMQSVRRLNPSIRVHFVNRQFVRPDRKKLKKPDRSAPEAEQQAYRLERAEQQRLDAEYARTFRDTAAQKYLNDLVLLRSSQRPIRVQKPLYVVNGTGDFTNHDARFLHNILEAVDEKAASYKKAAPLVMTGASHRLRGLRPIHEDFIPALDALENNLERDWGKEGFDDNNFHVFRLEDYAGVGGTRAGHDIVADVIHEVGGRREVRRMTTSEEIEFITQQLTELFRWYALYPAFSEYRGKPEKFKEYVLSKPRHSAPYAMTDEQLMNTTGVTSFVRWMRETFGLEEGQDYFIRPDKREVHLELGDANAEWPRIREAIVGVGAPPPGGSAAAPGTPPAP